MNMPNNAVGTQTEQVRYERKAKDNPRRHPREIPEVANS